MKFIDLRSDTVTQPTQEMRQAMAAAVVGDDVYEDDPTVARLQEMAAQMTGFAQALFVPSGTMANQLAIMTHTKRGDEIILGYHSHIAAHEVGAAAILANVSYRVVCNADDTISGRDVDTALRAADIHYPDTGLLCLENALSNGTVVPLEKMKDAYTAAKRHGLPVFLDGARLFNAAEYLKVSPKEITRYCDSAMFCLSKGLCAPVGSLLCGDTAFIKRARKYRKLLGGGMRQAGILAASGLIALEKMTKRLHIDHENAQYLARKLAALPHISLDKDAVHINLVFFKVTQPGFDHHGFPGYLLEKGIKINPADEGTYRLVTHHDISRQDIDYLLDIFQTVLTEESK
ncbi:MAG: low-specificity L-threonine aldolase [Defluviitaleaceae bacterium]|nr:low-specificity L-threonine aldolase [Defluviitaleaceae bacterium]